MGVDEEKCVRTCVSETVLIMLRWIDEAEARILLGAVVQTWQSTQRRYHESLEASPSQSIARYICHDSSALAHVPWERKKKKTALLMQGSPSKLPALSKF